MIKVSYLINSYAPVVLYTYFKSGVNVPNIHYFFFWYSEEKRLCFVPTLLHYQLLNSKRNFSNVFTKISVLERGPIKYFFVRWKSIFRNNNATNHSPSHCRILLPTSYTREFVHSPPSPKEGYECAHFAIAFWFLIVLPVVHVYVIGGQLKLSRETGSKLHYYHPGGLRSPATIKPGRGELPHKTGGFHYGLSFIWRLT